MTWAFDDGGREAAGFKGRTEDCVTRAIAIATGQPYREVYDHLHHAMKEARKRKPPGSHGSTSPRNGVPRTVYEPYLLGLGFTWLPLVGIGTGCKVHLDTDELAPFGDVLIARCSRHVVAVIGGVIRDTFDPSREGTRCVYGVYVPPEGW